MMQPPIRTFASASGPPLAHLRRGPCPTGRARRSVLIAALLTLAALIGALAPPLTSRSRTVTAATDVPIASEGLASGWVNWSWDSAITFNYTGGAYAGSSALLWEITRRWGGLYLHTDQPVQAGSDTTLSFAVYGTGTQQLTVVLYGAGNRQLASPRRLAEFGGDPPARAWKVYTIPLSSLGGAGTQITGVQFQNENPTVPTTTVLDELKLLGATTSGDTGGSTPNCSGYSLPAYPEIRAANTPYNQTAGRPTDPSQYTYGHPGFRPYFDKIDGLCTGTTEQILEWAAKKWGFDQLGYPDLAKAMAVNESWWEQSLISWRHGEFGVLQLRDDGWPDAAPGRTSTAYNADYAMAVIRMHYDGNSWLGAGTKGNVRNAVAAWECGCGNNGAGAYADLVFMYYNDKPWRNPGRPPHWF